MQGLQNVLEPFKICSIPRNVDFLHEDIHIFGKLLEEGDTRNTVQGRALHRVEVTFPPYYNEGSWIPFN